MMKILGNKYVKTFITIFRVCFISIIVLYLAFIIIQRLSGNKSIFGYRLFNVATGSMTGVYEINDVIAVKDWDIDTLKVGDDIAYKGNRGGLDGLLITHRIIKIEKSEDGGKLFTTKGVNAPGADPVITESQILGKVVGTVPVITQLNHVVKSQAGFFIFVFCPLVLIIVLEVLQTITDIKLEKNEIQRIEKEIADNNHSEEISDNEPVIIQETSEEETIDNESDETVESEEDTIDNEPRVSQESEEIELI